MEEKKDQNQKLQIQASTKKESLTGSIVKDITDNIIVPKFLDTMHECAASLTNAGTDAIQEAINRMFRNIGWKGGPRVTTNGNTNYGSYYRPANSTSSSTATVASANDRSATDIPLIFVQTENDAKMLIDSLRQDIQQYHRARVGDLYERVVPRIQAGNTFMNFKYGWTEQHFNNLGYHKIYTNEFGPEHNGDWVLDLPKPVSIVNI